MDLLLHFIRFEEIVTIFPTCLCLSMFHQQYNMCITDRCCCKASCIFIFIQHSRVSTKFSTSRVGTKTGARREESRKQCACLTYLTFKVSRYLLRYFDKRIKQIHTFLKSIKRVLSTSGDHCLFHLAFRVIHTRRYDFFEEGKFVHVSPRCHLLSNIKDIRFVHVYSCL